MKTIIEILEDKQVDKAMVNKYKYNALSGKEANFVLDIVHDEYKKSEYDYEQLKKIANGKDGVIEELKAAKEACDTCPLMSLDTQYSVLQNAHGALLDENYALKQAYESKDNQIGELIKVLSKLVND